MVKPQGSLPGMTDCILPINDATDIQYLSFMGYPRDMEYLDYIPYDKSWAGAPAPEPHDVEPVDDFPLSRKEVLDKIKLWELVQQTLTIKQFQVFEMYYIHDMTQEHIAEVLGLKGGQAVVSQILHLCVLRLRKYVGPTLVGLLSLPH